MSGDSDELLDPEEIEALLSAGKDDAPSSEEPASNPAPPEASSPPADDSSDELLDPDAIEALLREASGGSPAQAPQPPAASAPPPLVNAPSSASSLQGTEQLLQQAEADLAAAIAPELDPQHAIPPELANAKPFEFADFGGGQSLAGSGAGSGMHSLQDVELDLCIELGRTELLLEEVMKLKEGAVVPLNKLAGDPVDILVNGRLIARGEVLVLNDSFCVRVAEILAPED